MNATNPKTGGPLQGVRILDMTTVQLGPYGTLILADLGAEVIKVEAPGGDISRQSTPARSPKMGQSFLNGNRNKRSIVLDLKNPEGRTAILKIVEGVDAFVFNVRPQAMDRLGLTYEALSAVNKRLVCVNAVGFGRRGRYAGRPAYDDVIQGLVGLPWMAGKASGREPRYSPNAYADRATSLHFALAIVSAVYNAKMTGLGQFVEVPMFETMVHMVLGEHLEGETFRPAAGHMGHPRTLTTKRHPYRTKDGYICTLIYDNNQWRTFLKIVGQPELFEDSRFSSQIARVTNIDEVYGFLAEQLATRTTREWIDAFTKNDLAVGPMYSLEDILEDPHLQDVGYFKELNHPTEGPIRAMVYPTEFSKTPAESRYPAPALGEHTRQVLTEAGFSSADVDRLISSGAAACSRSASR